MENNMQDKQIDKQVERLNEILAIAVREKATDIQLLPGYAPVLKFPERSTEYGTTDLTSEDIRDFTNHMLSTRYEDVETMKNKSFSYELEDIARFRVSPFRSRSKLCLSIRIIPVEVRSFADLNLPEQIANISQLQRGLVLITGATGHGKSTTISAILQEINRTREAAMIITIEDPIEFTYKKQKAIIIQREIGDDIANLGEALEETLRHSPNVIMVGEIRNKETFEGVLTLAETGHLVISSIHTSDAKTTILRIVDFYSEAERQSVRNRLANSLKVVASQRLIRTAPSQIAERVPVCEILNVSNAVADSIRTPDKLDGIKQYMETDNNYYGMQTFDQHLIKLVKEAKIELNTAIAYANSPGEVERAYTLSGEGLD
jgi:twitching motility protein PilT